MITCPSCGAQNDPANRFCDQCGSQLISEPLATPPVVLPDQPTLAAPVCPNCGSPILPGEAFCDNCGADLSKMAMPAPPLATAPDAPTMMAAPVAEPGQGLCPACGAAVLPGERFCDNCGADLMAPPAATPVAPDAATLMAAPVSVPLVTEAPVAPVVEAPVAPVVEAPVAPVVEAPVASVVEAPVAPVVEAPAAPVVEAPAAPVVEVPAVPVVEVLAAPAPVVIDQAVLVAQRAVLEATIAQQQQIITQFEQMQVTFGAATPAAVTTGLSEAREALAHAEAELANLPPPAPAVDPALVRSLEETIARQQQIITQFEQMQAMFGAATPVAVTTGLSEAREALASAEAELAALGVTPTSVAPVVPSAPTPEVAPISVPEPASLPPPTPPTPTGPRLVLADGGSVIFLAEAKPEHIVGREDPVSNIFPEIDLTPHGGEMGGVSRQHARIVNNGGQWQIIDLNSTNYTRLDGVRIEPNTPIPLHDGARLQFGRIVLIFHL